MDPSGQLKEEGLLLTKQTTALETAQLVNLFICSHFGFNEEWDTKLLKCISMDNKNFDDFEFRTNHPSLIYHIKIQGNSNLIFNRPENLFYLPLENKFQFLEVEISVDRKERPILVCYPLVYEKIRQSFQKDYSVVSLYNSSSFLQFSESCTTNRYKRTLTKSNFDKIKIFSKL